MKTAAFDGSTIDQPPSGAARNGGNGHAGIPVPDHGTDTTPKDHSLPDPNGPSRPNSSDLPGAFINSRVDYWISKKERPEVNPDRDVVLAAAWNNSGEAVVREHHTAKFNSIWADCERVFLEVVGDIQGNIQSGMAHLRELTQLLHRTDRYIEIERRTQPWTVWEAVQLAAVLVFSLMLLGVDVNSAAVTLMESGIEAFRGHYGRAALFNLSVIMGAAFIIKSVTNWLETDYARRRYTLLVFAAAGIALAAAIPVFAQTYSRLSADPIALMTASQTASQGPNSGWTFALQLMVGNLVAGAMWLTASQIVESHAPSVRAESPIWRRVKDDLDAQATGLREEREKLGLFQGKLDVINSKRNLLITRAVEMYRLAAADAERARKTAALLNEFPADQSNNDKKRKP